MKPGRSGLRSPTRALISPLDGLWDQLETVEPDADDLLARLRDERGLTLVLVTHDLAEGLRLGRLLVLMDRGRVVGRGDPATLIARPGTLAAAHVVGTENLFDARVVRHLPADGCSVVDLGGIGARVYRMRPSQARTG